MGINFFWNQFYTWRGFLMHARSCSVRSLIVRHRILHHLHRYTLSSYFFRSAMYYSRHIKRWKIRITVNFGCEEGSSRILFFIINHKEMQGTGALHS
jgi:hypothetical protein